MRELFKKLISRQTGVNGAFAALAVFGLVIVFLVNMLAVVVAGRYPLDVDLTRNSAFRLSDKTVDYIQALPQPVAIQVLAREETFTAATTYNAQANALFHEFAKRSPQISLTYIDYVKDPSFAGRYPTLTMKHGDVLVSSGGKTHLVQTEDLFNYAFDAAGQPSITSSRAEEAITAAIVNVTSARQTVVTLLEGHGEADISAFVKLLETNNYEVRRQSLATGDIDPASTFAVLAAPRTDLTAEELDKLDRFLENDGRYGKTLFYFATAVDAKPLPNLGVFLREWGIVPGDGLVFETDENRVFQYQPFVAIVDYQDEHYADMLRVPGTPVLMPFALPFTTLYETRDQNSVQTLLAFGASAGVRPSSATDSFKASDATIRGPMPAMVLASRALRDKGDGQKPEASHIVVSASSEMLNESIIGSTAFNNAEYLLNLFADLSGNASGIAVTPKKLAGSALNFPMATADRVGIFFMVVLPVVVLGLGTVIWLRRRHR